MLAALPGPSEAVLLGDPNAKSEHVVAYEAGYQREQAARLSIDATVFLNSYYGLQSVEPEASFVQTNPALLVEPQSFENKLHGTTEGAEFAVNWKAMSRWTLSPGYTFLEMHLHTDPDSQDSTSVTDIEGTSPHHQAQLRSHIELRRNLTWDASGYFAGPIAGTVSAVVHARGHATSMEAGGRAGFERGGTKFAQESAYGI